MLQLCGIFLIIFHILCFQKLNMPVLKGLSITTFGERRELSAQKYPAHIPVVSYTTTLSVSHPVFPSQNDQLLRSIGD